MIVFLLQNAINTFFKLYYDYYVLAKLYEVEHSLLNTKGNNTLTLEENFSFQRRIDSSKSVEVFSTFSEAHFKGSLILKKKKKIPNNYRDFFIPFHC